MCGLLGDKIIHTISVVKTMLVMYIIGAYLMPYFSFVQQFLIFHQLHKYVADYRLNNV